VQAVIIGQYRSGELQCRLFQERFGLYSMSEQRFELSAKFCIAITRLVQKLAAVFRLAFQRRVIEPLDLPPTLGIHGRPDICLTMLLRGMDLTEAAFRSRIRFAGFGQDQAQEYLPQAYSFRLAISLTQVGASTTGQPRKR
jgi:hypothetical protein